MYMEYTPQNIDIVVFLSWWLFYLCSLRIRMIDKPKRTISIIPLT